MDIKDWIELICSVGTYITGSATSSCVLFGKLQVIASQAIGAIWFCLYYFSFKFLIEKFNIKTPGRDEELSVVQTLTDAEQIEKIFAGLGGRKNIEELDNCITRLRITVKDAALVNEKILKESGAQGVIASGVGVQIVYGTGANIIKNKLEEAIV